MLQKKFHIILSIIFRNIADEMFLYDDPNRIFHNLFLIII